MGEAKGDRATRVRMKEGRAREGECDFEGRGEGMVKRDRERKGGGR